MEFGAHGGPEMKVTCHSAPAAALTFKIRGLIAREDSESGLGMGGFLQKHTNAKKQKLSNILDQDPPIWGGTKVGGW